MSSAGLSYRRNGLGSPVLLLHGIPGSGATWDAVVEHLAAGVDAVVPDLAGFGGSPPARSFDDLHAGAQSVAVERLLDELGIRQAVVVGHDFGGPVALLLAARRPDLVSAVSLLAANTFTDTPIPFPLSAVTWPLVGPLAAQVLFSKPSLKMMLRQGVGPGATPPPAPAYLGERDQQRAIATIFAGSLVRLGELYRPVEDALRSMSIPAAVGWGDHDPFFSVSQGERTAIAARAKLRVHEGAGHFLPHERPGEVSADILDLVQLTRS